MQITDSDLALLKELKPKEDEHILLEETIEKAKKKLSVGKTVRIIGTGYTGIVKGFNERLGGFYPGVRYPIFVKIIYSKNEKFKEAEGQTFEYGIDQLK